MGRCGSSTCRGPPSPPPRCWSAPGDDHLSRHRALRHPTGQVESARQGSSPARPGATGGGKARKSRGCGPPSSRSASASTTICCSATRAWAKWSRSATAVGAFVPGNSSPPPVAATPATLNIRWSRGAGCRRARGSSSRPRSVRHVVAIALHGFRLASVDVGAKVVVVGLGWSGNWRAVSLLAAGCDVFGIDVNPARSNVPSLPVPPGTGEQGDDTTALILDWSRGRGADAVLIVAGASGDSRIIRAVPDRCRDRADVVVPSATSASTSNATPSTQRELRLEVARSYGPGRYEPQLRGMGGRLPRRLRALDRGTQPRSRARPARVGRCCVWPTW